MPSKKTVIPDRFDIFLTVDQNIAYQQNLTNLRFVVVIVSLPQNRLEHFMPVLPQIRTALANCKPGDVIRVAAPK